MKILWFVLLICFWGYGTVYAQAPALGGRQNLEPLPNATDEYLGTLNNILTAQSGSGATATRFCLGCPYVQQIYKTVSDLATTATDVLKKVSFKLLTVGFLFVLALRILKYFTAFQELDFWDVFSDLAKIMFRVILAFVCLVYVKDIFTYIINPVLNLAIGIAGKIQHNDLNLTLIPTLQTASGETKACAITTCGVRAGQLLGDALCTNITKLICSFNISLLLGLVISLVLTAVSFADTDQVSQFFKDFIAGGALVMGYISMYMQLPVLFLDMIFRLGFVFLLSPIYVVLWAFPATVGYTKKAWNIIVQSCFLLVCLSAFIILIEKLFTYTFKGTENLDVIINYLQEKNYDAAAKALGLFDVPLIMTIAICLAAHKILALAVPLSVKLSEKVPDLGMGQVFSKTIVQGGKIVANTVSAGKNYVSGRHP